jgi:UDP-N-acetylglucosamine 2-epimerase (non-hydrolysing)
VKVLSVVGARPQFVKAFPLSRALRPDHEEVLVHTGQHYDEELSDVFFEELDVTKPAYNLGVGSGTHAAQTAEVVQRLDPVVEDEDPDWLLLYGDTNSTLGGAIVGAKRDVRVAHVEAGLRSHNREMPEEINRILTDHASDLLFAPTDAARETLEREGLGRRTHVTGDVMYDALLWARDVALRETSIVGDLDLERGEYVLATVHRPRNADNLDRLAAILDALVALPQRVVFPVHPRTGNKLNEFELRERAERELTLIDPAGYLEFVALLAGSRTVVTDSGGVQKEAFFLDTPCVTLREETEWIETVENGWNRLVGANTDKILKAVSERPPDQKSNPYGGGEAAVVIRDLLVTESSAN